MAKGGPDSWVSAAVEELRRADSWTGRIHVHKCLFLVRLLGLAKPPFRFEFYRFGPYSRQLDSRFSGMETLGQLEKDYPKPGYGPKYRSVEHLSDSLAPCDRDAIQKVARALGQRDSRQLELLATCLWVERHENITDDKSIIARVKELKPKYEREEIRRGLQDARRMAEELTAGA